MSRLEDNFRKVEPYVPGEQPNLPDMVKLNTNENPYPPSPKVAEALQKFELDSLRLYPDPASTDLVNALAEKYHVQLPALILLCRYDPPGSIAWRLLFLAKNVST